MGTIRCVVCGEEAEVANSAMKRRSTCSKKCGGKRLSQLLSGEKNYNWKGGVRHSDGYVLKKVWGHPSADENGYVLEHRLVMEERLGRYLKTDEIVHHKNRNRSDNRLENLELIPSRAEHMRLHSIESMQERGIDIPAGYIDGDELKKACVICGTLFLVVPSKFETRNTCSRKCRGAEWSQHLKSIGGIKNL